MGQQSSFNRYPIPRKLMEEREFQDLLNSLNVSIFISDSLFSHLISFSSNLAKIIGVDSLALKNNPSMWGDILRSEEGSKIDEILIQALDNNNEVQFDLSILNGQGKKRKVHIQLIMESHSYHHEIFGQIRDVTDLREKEIALARMESYEVEISAKIQKKLLLGKPRGVPKELKIHASSIPSQMVDGDFYDFNSLSAYIQDFFIGDVMGKGFNAALLGAGAKNLFNKALLNLLTQGNSSPPLERIMDLTDSYLTKDLIQLNSFMTLNYSRIDTENGIYQFLDCGHNPVIHYSQISNECWLLKGDNKPLGFQHHQEFISCTYPINQGDILFLYSDGIIETVNQEGELFGIERLVHLISGYNQMAVEHLVSKVLEVSFDYSFSGFSDDVTALAAKYQPEHVFPFLMKEEFSFRDPNLKLKARELVELLRPKIQGKVRHGFSEEFLGWFFNFYTMVVDHIPEEYINKEPLEELGIYDDDPQVQRESDSQVSCFIREKRFFLSICFTGDFPLLNKESPFDQLIYAEGLGGRKRILAIVNLLDQTR